MRTSRETSRMPEARDSKQSGLARSASVLTIIGFLVAVAEMIFMASPFAVYFYALYSPFLQLLQSTTSLSWLSQFWLNHIAPPHWFVTSIRWTGSLLTLTGLGLFLAHAGYLYWMKFRKRAIATRLLYGYVRHPQYTGLLMAGCGLALLWPRFVNLVLLLAMVGAYYTLARYEEARMRTTFPDGYPDYAATKSMFIPGGPGEWLQVRLLGWIPATSARGPLLILLLAFVVLAGAFLIREMCVHGLQVIEVNGTPD